MADKFKLIIADDHHIFRKGILSMVSEDAGIEIIGEAANGDEAYKLIADNLPILQYLILICPV